jgi:CRP/FNR family transcriptional regulator, anaerobic regulatory protein
MVADPKPAGSRWRTPNVTLSELVRSCPSMHLVAGAAVHPPELADETLIFVEQGLVVLRTTVAGSSRRTITCHAGSGALVLAPGEEELLVALTDTTLKTILPSTRDHLLEQPAAARLIVCGLAETLRQKHATIASMAHLHHVDRVREKLLELAREHGKVGREMIRLDFPLTHDLLGEMTGSARETVTRALDELQREGFVVRQGRTYGLHVSPDTL